MVFRLSIQFTTLTLNIIITSSSPKYFTQPDSSLSLSSKIPSNILDSSFIFIKLN